MPFTNKIIFLSPLIILSVQCMTIKEKNIELFDSIEKSDVILVNKAISAGAEINCIDDYHHMSPLIYSIIFGKKKMTTDWVEPYYEHYSIKIDVIKVLIQAGANVNAQHKKRTPLYLAVDNNHLLLTKLLIISGAFIDNITVDGKTIMNIAKTKSKSIFEFLEKTRSENIEKRKRRIQEEAGKYISTGSYGPLQYVLEYAEEYVPELEYHEEEIWSV